MSTPEHAHASGLSLVDRRLPPVTEIGAASMIAIAGGVIYLASYLPKHAPLGVAIVLLVLAAALQLANAILLFRVHPFAWKRFFQVGRWALLGYAVCLRSHARSSARRHDADACAVHAECAGADCFHGRTVRSGVTHV